MRKDVIWISVVVVLVVVVAVLLGVRNRDHPRDPDVRDPDPERSPAGGVGRGDDPQKTLGLGGPGSRLPGIPQGLPTLPKLSPTDIVKDAFKFGRDAAQSVDELGQEAFALSEDEEKRWGSRLHEALGKERRILVDAALQARMAALAEPLLKTRGHQGISYTFTVIDAPEVNAFSIVGGYVYVNKGLVDFAKTDAELQFVLGHEIGHVDLRHCAKKLTYVARADELASGVAGSIVGLAYELVARGYTKEHEFEADDWAYRAMRRIGRTQDEASRFMRRLRDREMAQGAPRRKDPRSAIEAAVQEVKSHYESHPPTEERLRRLEASKR